MSNTIIVSGNLTFGSGMHVSGTSGISINQTGNLTSNTFVFPNNLGLTGSGKTFTLQDAWSIGGNLVLSGATSTIINGFSFTLGGSISQSTTAVISGSTTLIMTGTGTTPSWTNSSTGALQNNLTFNAPGKTITIS